MYSNLWQDLLQSVADNHEPRSLSSFLLHESSPVYQENEALWVQQASEARQPEEASGPPSVVS